MSTLELPRHTFPALNAPLDVVETFMLSLQAGMIVQLAVFYVVATDRVLRCNGQVSISCI